ncbi:hydroxyacid dehydrogenase [Paenibacillus sp. J2TS4]|uniref:hydroxyacid dehydrogenase n=1 Tax=Paenibacillus sp. J2TS4 TaxID=2807194 RepID=UPI001AFEE56A|nr:hydroxyacid dehydrogenase [Paenibacillus sp. J2TS4]GIP33895.1 dehydrogenase [Paenibacillus sp. J2TS4]
MSQIAMLAGREMLSGIFAPKDLDQLRKLGTLKESTVDESPTAEQVKELIRGADIAITTWGSPRLDLEIIKEAPNLKLVMHAAGTVKGIVSPEMAAKGIRVSSANGALGIGVAETALGLTITSLKNMWQLAKNTRAGEWAKDKEKIREVYGVTIGVVGAGRAGRHYIKLMKNFNVEIILYDPIVTAEQAAELGVTKVSLEDLLVRSDVVSIHAPSIPETNKMFNQETLSLMKDDAILINTSRGSLIDEDALVEELERGRLTACIDVTDPEPPRQDHPFRRLPNVILIPHIAGAVNNGKLRMGEYSVEEIRRFLNNEPLDGEVNLQQLHTIA